ncbi:ankyrin repeat domain-containing protein [Streptomyces sp. NPDC006463]|uniref:ankyrin repeat domain-containing protein n=1 Tax=Streptomyces sp. NPDC006463 TaxID=3364746 RepID=UPI0036A7F25C
MSRKPLVGGLPVEELALWHLARRYAVPRWMIEGATEARSAGDWRSACAVSAVDVALDPVRIMEHYGAAVWDSVADDLAHLAPDLLRWHLPRLAYGTVLAPRRVILLARHGSPADAEAAYLAVITPARYDGPQRLVLDFLAAEAPELRSGGVVEDWTLTRHLWDARHAPELRERCGGAGRLPFFHADGTPLGPRELPDTDPAATDPAATDPAAREEWVAVLQARGDIAGAFAAVGIDADLTILPRAPDVIAGLPLDLPRMDREVRRLLSAGVADRFRIPGAYGGNVLLEPAGPGAHVPLRARACELYRHSSAPTVPRTAWRRLPDLQLVRTGRVAPEELHPLVTAALFPAAGPAYGPPGPPAALEPVRVRCGGEWHLIAFRDGELRIPHSAREQQREQAMRAFGGAVAGCFAVQQAWASGRGRLPRALRPLRRELFERARHGDAPGVAALLAAGVDPAVRDNGTGQSLQDVLGPLGPEAG